jgi:pimeloyl-ACP methyl ester carboxylesterase
MDKYNSKKSLSLCASVVELISDFCSMKKIIFLVVGILFLGFVFAIYFRPKQIIAAGEVKAKYTLPSSHFINWRGTELHYTDEGSGFPIIMLHGFGGSHRNFNKITELLKDSFRVVRLDLPGFGMSDMPKGENINPPEIYRDYLKFLTDSLNIDSFYVMGNSMGGWVAWQIAVENPDKVKGLVLLGSAGYEMDKIKTKAVNWIKLPFVVKALERGMPYSASKDAGIRCWANDSLIDPVEVQANNDFWNREGNIHCAFAVASSDVMPDTTKLQTLNCPTLIVWGKQDEIIPSYHAEKFHRDIKNSTMIVYDPCGHLPQVEMAEQYEKDFLKFIKK